MIEHTLDSAHSILYVRPKSKLEQDDCVQLAKAVDPHIEEKGDLAGLIIEVASFPGWESLGDNGEPLSFCASSSQARQEDLS
jgi:hypothetical protein